MISPYKIKWAGLSSLDLDLWTELSFDGDSGPTSTFLNKENIITEHYDGRRTIHRSKHQDVLTPTVTFVKQDYEEISFDENRKILSWLTSSEYPGYLEVYHDDSEVMSYKLFGNWTEVEQYKLSGSRVAGYVATFESSAPYAYSRKFTYPEVYATTDEINNNDENNDYLAVSGTEEITIICNSDEYNKLLYPKVTIIFDESNTYFPVTTDPMASNYTMIPNVIYSYNGKLYINVNQGDADDQGKYVIAESLSTDTPASSALVGRHYYFPQDKTVKKVVTDSSNTNYAWKIVSIVGSAIKIDNSYTLNGEATTKEVIVAGGAPGETIVLDGNNKVISGGVDNQLRIVGDDFNWEWPSLVSGENILAVTGNCRIKFEWLEPRKVGSL